MMGWGKAEKKNCRHYYLQHNEAYINHSWDGTLWLRITEGISTAMIIDVYPNQVYNNECLKGVLVFPGGAVVKNPPANAEDTGPSPDPGRSHMPRSN